MGKRDPRVDAYIARSADFAKPILTRIRTVVHDACPEVEETIKWGFPHFDHQGILCGMGAFKEHCTFGFWKGSLIVGSAASKEAMGQFGCLTSVRDLPSRKVFAGFVRQAARLNEEGVKVPSRSKPRAKKPEARVPRDMAALLGKNAKTKERFASLSPSQRREYVEWITEAKTDATRQKRLATAIEWISEGKSRNWKYRR